MKLKKLAICGFKSFADKAALEFSSGITAIVGPNGCGKSNIVDSFRWVMGEQSAKAIRGDKMLDIIFAGAGKRKPLNMAEVTLTFTNVEGVLPVDYGEVSICRRVFRNGESEFFINRNPVRLKDIESLFWDTGLGKDAFCIFEQGKIDQLIQYSPIERRSIFEEAAGILRFKQRKKEALRKLEQAEANFSRAEDIFREVFQQREILEKQAQEAIAYKQKKAELERLEKELFVEKWERIHQKSVHLLDQFEVEKQKIASDMEAHAVLDAEWVSLKSIFAEKDQIVKNRTEQLFQAKNELEVKAVELRSHLAYLEDSGKKADKFLQDLELLKQRRQKKREEYQQHSCQLQRIEEEAKESEKALKEHRALFAHLRQNADRLRDKQKGVQQDRLLLSQQESKIKSQIQEHRMRMEAGKEKLIRLGGVGEKLEKLEQDLLQSEKEKRNLLHETSSLIDEKKKILTHSEKLIEAVQEELKCCLERLKVLQKEKAELSARQKVLLRLKEDMEGLSPGTKRFLQESQQIKSVLYGKLQPLYELLAAQPGFEMALASALRPYSQTLLVRTFQDMQLVLDFAKDHHLKEFSILCMEEIASSHESSFRGESEGLDPLISHLVHSPLSDHFFREIYLVEDLAGPTKPRTSWITKEGFFKDQQSVLLSPIHAEKNTFLREAELKGLVDSLGKVDAKQVELDDQHVFLEDKKQQLQLQRGDLDKAVRILEMKLVEINFGLQRVLADREKAVHEKQQSRKDFQEIEESMANASVHLADWMEKDASLKEQMEERQNSFQQVELELQQCLSQVKEKDEHLRELEACFKEKNDAYQRLSQLCQGFKAADQEQAAQELRLQEDYKLHLEKKAALLDRSKMMEEAVEKAGYGRQESAALLEESEKELAACKDNLSGLEAKVKTVVEEMKTKELNLHRKEIQIVEEKSALSSLEESFFNQYSMTIEQVKAEALAGALTPAKSSMEKKEKHARELRRDLENAGDVNLGAVEEFEKHRVREDFLRQQLDDMQRSKGELIQIITRLDNESRKIFEDAFIQIRRNFQKNFNLLFEGGEADLTFTESPDLLEAGIEITAKPPGKQMRSISLLSGGEKCLTAMALLFAIFEIRPSAFCLLDEVDAPLDEANVGRFTNMVRQFVDKTQFIIITHNKRTMAIADVLFGVSMEEKGVSKLLSLVFDRKQVTLHGEYLE